MDHIIKPPRHGEGEKLCKHCKEIILSDATKCKYCQCFQTKWLYLINNYHSIILIVVSIMSIAVGIFSARISYSNFKETEKERIAADKAVNDAQAAVKSATEAFKLAEAAASQAILSASGIMIQEEKLAELEKRHELLIKEANEKITESKSRAETAIYNSIKAASEIVIAEENLNLLKTKHESLIKEIDDNIKKINKLIEFLNVISQAQNGSVYHIKILGCHMNDITSNYQKLATGAYSSISKKMLLIFNDPQWTNPAVLLSGHPDYRKMNFDELTKYYNEVSDFYGHVAYVREMYHNETIKLDKKLIFFKDVINNNPNVEPVFLASKYVTMLLSKEIDFQGSPILDFDFLVEKIDQYLAEINKN